MEQNPIPKGKNVKGDLERKRAKALENLAKARQKRMEMLKARKEKLQTHVESESDSEYVIYSSETESEDYDIPVMKMEKLKNRKQLKNESSKDDQIEKLLNTMEQLLQVQTTKPKKKPSPQPIINNIMVPQQPSKTVETSKEKDTDPWLEDVRKIICG